MSLRLIYGRDAAHLMKSYKPYDIVKYSDNNYTSNLKDRKSIIGYCFLMNKAIVIWSCKKQRIMSTFIIEIEYIGLGYGLREGILIRRFINKLIPKILIQMLMLFGDNKISIS